MKINVSSRISLFLLVILLIDSLPLYAADPMIDISVPGRAIPVSSRLIVKFKTGNLKYQDMSVSQINAQHEKRLTAQAVSRMQTVAGRGMSELHATSSGGHVMLVDGPNDKQAFDNAIAAISSLPEVEYVEEDRIQTEQTATNDTYYTSFTNGGNTYPGLWGMWPVSPVAASAPGLTGSYGADFETAWIISTGAGVVVAVVDSGITPSYDIVGPSGLIQAGAGSNLISVGYDFISDCRVRGTCAATTLSANATVAPTPDATDLGNYITAQDIIDNPALFPGPNPSKSTWHGTHVAGTIAAIANNNRGVAGGAYSAKILPVRVLGKGGGYTSDIADGIKWAAGVHPTIPNPNPAKVINLSMGGAGSCTLTEQNAINAAVGAGAVVVVAAGNSNTDVASHAPANCQNVISVAAIGRDGSRASYSNFSSPTSNVTNPTTVTLAAPGGDTSRADADLAFDAGIFSAINMGTTTMLAAANGGSGYGSRQGTSMATPMVSAVAALMISKDSTLTPAQIKTILSAPSSLTAFPSFGATSYPALNGMDCTVGNNCGTGILNARLALRNTPSKALTGTAAVDFGSVVVSGSSSKYVTFYNTSSTTVQLTTAATVTGSNLTYFNVTSDGCNGTYVIPNATCGISVNYLPSQGGAHTATLSVLVDGAPSPTLVSLTGSAGTSVLTTSTPNVTATTVDVGQSTAVNLSYANPNSLALRTGAVIMSQPSIMAASSDGCSNVTLAAGASCALTVIISPKTGGSYSGVVSLGLSGGGAATDATITGNANAFTARTANSGGGGCAIMPFGATPDISLLLAVIAAGAYWLRWRVARARSAD